MDIGISITQIQYSENHGQTIYYVLLGKHFYEKILITPIMSMRGAFKRKIDQHNVEFNILLIL